MNIKHILFAIAIATLTSCGTSSKDNNQHNHSEETETHEHAHTHHEHAHEHEHGIQPCDHNAESHEHCEEHAEHAHEHEIESHEHNHAHESHEHNHDSHAHDAHGENPDEIIFSEAKAKHFGVKTSIVSKGHFNDIIKVSGEIMPAQGDESVISAKSSGILTLNANAIAGKQVNTGTSIGKISSQNVAGGDANETARINYEAAKRELERITPLYNDKIITEREYNLAKQAFDQAKAAMSNSSGAGSAATSNISGTITKMYVKDGEFVEIGTPIAVVSKNSHLVLRADLPNRYASAVSTIKTANFKPSYSETVYELSKLNGKIVSNKNLTVVTPGYIPINFEFSNSASIVPGTFAEIYLIGSTKHNVVTVPLSSITEEEGYFFVYEKTDHEGYMKREVKLGMNNGEYVEIISGLHEGTEIVTEGAILIKLASQAGSVPGHSHEH